MRPTLRKAALAAGALAVVLILSAVIFTAWLLRTESGARFALGLALGRVPGEVSVERVHGSIWSPLHFEGVRVAYERMEIEIDSVDLSWRPLDLLALEVTVHSLRLDAPRIRWLPADTSEVKPEAEKPPFVLEDFELPVDVVLEELRILNAAVYVGEPEDTLVIRELVVEQFQARDSLGVHRLSVQSPMGQVELGGFALTRGEFPLAIELEWVLRPPGFAPVEGSGRIDGDLEELHVRQATRAPLRAGLDATLTDLFETPRFHATLEVDEVRLDSLDAALPALRVALETEASGTIDSLVAQTRTRFRSPELGGWESELSSTLRGERLEIEELRLRRIDGAERAQGRGRLEWSGGEPRASATLEWSDLRWPLFGDTLATSPSGTLRFDGTASRYKVHSDAVLSRAGLPPLRVAVRARGDTASAQVDSLRFRSELGAIDGSGRFHWSPDVRWTLALEGREILPEVVVPELPGQLSFSAESEGELRGETVRVIADLHQIRGELRGLPVEGDARLALAEAGRSEIDTELRWGEMEWEAEGKILGPWDVNWSLYVPQLGRVDSSLAGTIEASGTLAGADSLPEVRADALVSDLRIAGTELGEVRLDADFALDTERPHRLDLLATGVDLPVGARIDSGHITFEGTLASHEIAVHLLGPERALDLVTAGSWEDSTWIGEMQHLEFDTARDATWSLEETVSLRAARDAVQVDPICLRSDGSRLCLGGTWKRSGDWSALWEAEAVRLADLADLYPEGIALYGTLDANVEASGDSSGTLVASGRISPSPGLIETRQFGRVDTVQYSDGLLLVESDPDSLSLQMTLESAELGSISLRAALPGFRIGREPSEQPIRGELELDLDDLGFVDRMFADIENLHGEFEADVSFHGDLAQPHMIGSFGLHRASFDVPFLGLEVDSVQFTSKGDGVGLWTSRGRLRSGPGRLYISAEQDFSNAREPRAEIRIQGTRVLVVNSFDSIVYASPDLTIRQTGSRFDVSGEVVVPEADIRIRNLNLESAVPPSNDVVYAHVDRDSTDAPLDIYAEVRVTLGEKIRFDGFGLRAEPRGSILAIDSPGNPTLGRGELAIERGVYRGFGQELEIERGRLLFGGGPIDNPSLDIRAVREIQSEAVTVGLDVSGTLRNPRLDVFSATPMTQDEALSYLLFGHASSSSSGEQNDIARDAATAMSLQAGSYYTQQMASKLGFDEARLESSGDLKETSVMLGTYLSPQLFISYGIGLFDSQNSFLVRYFLNRRWTIEAESAKQNSADLIYSIER